MSDLIETWKNDFRAFVNSLNLSRDDYKTMMEYIDEIPAVQPDHVADISKKVEGDCISRRAAIDALDENIKHFDDMAEECRRNANIERNDYMDMRDDAAEYRQLSIWLNELKWLRERFQLQPEQHWIPCSEKMPSETVIVTVETKAFKHRYVCEAAWIPRWTWKASFDEWEDCSEYNEDDDEYYVLEGWYERIHNWDEYTYVAIDDNVIAWMPLPEPYRGGETE